MAEEQMDKGQKMAEEMFIIESLLFNGKKQMDGICKWVYYYLHYIHTSTRFLHFNFYFKSKFMDEVIIRDGKLLIQLFLMWPHLLFAILILNVQALFSHSWSKVLDEISIKIFA